MRRLTSALGLGLLFLLLECLLGLLYEVLALVNRMLQPLLVMRFLQCPAMHDPVEHTREKGSVPDNLCRSTSSIYTLRRPEVRTYVHGSRGHRIVRLCSTGIARLRMTLQNSHSEPRAHIS